MEGGLQEWQDSGGARAVAEAAEAEALQASQILPPGAAASHGADESGADVGDRPQVAGAIARFLRDHQCPPGDDWRQWAKQALLELCMQDSARALDTSLGHEASRDSTAAGRDGTSLSADEAAEQSAGDLGADAALDALARPSPELQVVARATLGLSASVQSLPAPSVETVAADPGSDVASDSHHTMRSAAGDELVSKAAARVRLPGILIGKVARHFLQDMQPGSFSLLLSGRRDLDRDRPSMAVEARGPGAAPLLPPSTGSGPAGPAAQELGPALGVLGLPPADGGNDSSQPIPSSIASSLGTTPAASTRPSPICRMACRSLLGGTRLVLSAYPVVCFS